MSTIYSKLPNPQAHDPAMAKGHNIQNTDFDLINMIKLAITKLKSNNIKLRKSRTVKYPCSVCDKNCMVDAIFCTHCNKWVHRKCNATSKQEYASLSAEPDDAPFQCLLCSMKENSQIFPFFFLDKIELLELNGVDLPSHLKLLGNYDIKSKLANMPNLNDFDLDENLIHKVNSNYQDIISFQKIRKTKNSFSLIHSNLRSLSGHLDELQLLLNALKLQFDVIGISESKEQESGFLTNVNLCGYVLHSQYSNTAAGGVVLYVKDNLDYLIRDDLSIREDEFETLWIDIKNSKSQNILCGCAYRYPNTDVKKFNDYVNQTMQKISKENKLVFLMGDFNVNLLNYESHGEKNEFINTMVSHYLLPHILHPTRVTDHSATVIDNIFSNNTQHETTSGNLITQISDHFPQFLILNQVFIDYRTCTYAKRHFSKFDQNKFVKDFSNQTMDFLENSSISTNRKFDLFYEMVSSYVDHHVPIKKLSKKDLKFLSNPWINLKIQRLIKYRDKLLRKLNRKFTHNNEYLYKKFRNRVVNELRTSKTKYYNQYVKSIINIKNIKFNAIS